jgi:hypothetical protein
MSDGGQLLRMPARRRVGKDLAGLLAKADWQSQPEAADLLLRGCRLEIWSAIGRLPTLAQPLRQAGRTKDLLWVHQLRVPPLSSEQYTPQQAQQWALAVVERPDGLTSATDECGMTTTGSSLVTRPTGQALDGQSASPATLFTVLGLSCAGAALVLRRRDSTE